MRKIHSGGKSRAKQTEVTFAISQLQAKEDPSSVQQETDRPKNAKNSSHDYDEFVQVRPVNQRAIES